MRTLHILGTGCAKCEKLTANAEQAAADLGIDYKLEKVTQVADIAKFGVMMTPALVVDGAVKVVGKVPGVDEIKAMLA